jgi:glycosyltransferase involved in cell wall biosynthesis
VKEHLPVCVVIPALNEEATIEGVILDLQKAFHPSFHLSKILVVDNGSSDSTAAKARAAGAEVVYEKERGYGAACLAGIAAISQLPEKPVFVLFADADGSDAASLWPKMLLPLLEQKANLVIGSRVLGDCAKGALSIPQRFGNWLATALINRQYNSNFTDLGPFRALRYSDLLSLEMKDRAYGWTIEMQLKALRMGMTVQEIPTPYYCRKGGKSKISGSIKGSFLAGRTILGAIARDWYSRGNR